MTNAANCAAGIDALIAQLQRIRKAIQSGDEKKVKKLLEQAAQKRNQLIQYKINQKELF